MLYFLVLNIFRSALAAPDSSVAVQRIRVERRKIQSVAIQDLLVAYDLPFLFQLPLRNEFGSAIELGDWLLTTAHVVAGAERIEAQSHGGDWIAVSLFWISPKMDMALLTREEGTPMEVHGMPERGEIVTAVGFIPNQEGLFVMDGVVEERLEWGALQGPHHPTTRFSGTLLPGMSGGALLDEEGHLVGMNLATKPKENHSYALSLEQFDFSGSKPILHQFSEKYLLEKPISVPVSTQSEFCVWAGGSLSGMEDQWMVSLTPPNRASMGVQVGDRFSVPCSFFSDSNPTRIVPLERAGMSYFAVLMVQE